MDELERQVGRARRRLGAQRFVAALGWCWTAALGVAVIVILVGKFWPLGLPDVVWPAAALVAGAAAAAGWALWRGRGPIDAAIEIDRRWGLKERVSSSLALSPDERDSAVGRALVEDAVRRVRRIEISERMNVAPDRRLLFPLVPALIGFLVVLFVQPAVVENPAEATTDPGEVKKQVERSVEKLESRLAKKQEEAQRQGLKEAQQVFKLLQEGAKNLKDKAPEDRKQALLKLNDLAKQLEERRRKAGGAEQIRQKLNQMKNLSSGPADKLAQAIKQGDFEKARKEIEALRDKMAQGQLDKEAQKKLADQMREMKDKLEKMAAAQKKAEQELKKEIDQANKSGDQKKADQLQQQLDQLQQQSEAMRQMEQIAQQLGQCAECMNRGEMQEAAEAMQGLQQQLSDLQQQAQELQMLDEAMQQMAQCRQGMGCPHCGGAGCPACQGGMGDKRGEGGNGLGPGEGGWGPRPEQEGDTAFRDTQVQQKPGPGSMTIVGQVEGPNKKGDVSAAIQEQVEAAKHQAEDPLTNQRLPRSHRDHAREYLER
ncbi:MAG: hypothetical protein JW809_04250, partial [Pirellulales bacterium]|nr:hypothetical protein [Pirellulales bacterium]